MRSRVIYLCVTAIAMIALAGCRQDPNILLLRRDLRLQEDHIYHLEDTLAEYEDRLASCHRQNEALKRRLAAGEGGAPVEPLLEPPREVRPERKRPPAEVPLPPANGIGPPKIDLGTETPPEEIQPKSEPKRLPKSPEPEPSAHINPNRERGMIYPAAHADVAHHINRTQGVARPESAKGVARDEPRVRSIVINPRLSGGNKTDGRFGDEGVMLVLETRDENGRLVEAPGEMSLVILDPTESGEAAQVAEWNFTTDDMAVKFRRARFAQGYILELPWPGDPPKHEQLTMRIRYTTPDGRTLTAERPFKAEILGHDEFLTRSVRPQRQKPWFPDRSTDSATTPATYEELATPPRSSVHAPLTTADPSRSTLRSSPSTGPRPQWRPDR